MKADISRFQRFSSRRSPHLHHPEWQAEYQAAISELELNRLFDRVAEAEVCDLQSPSGFGREEFGLARLGIRIRRLVASHLPDGLVCSHCPLLRLPP